LSIDLDHAGYQAATWLMKLYMPPGPHAPAIELQSNQQQNRVFIGVPAAANPNPAVRHGMARPLKTAAVPALDVTFASVPEVGAIALPVAVTSAMGFDGAGTSCAIQPKFKL